MSDSRAQVEQEWRLVPVEPPEAVVVAGDEAAIAVLEDHSFALREETLARKVWRAMLGAAPSPWQPMSTAPRDRTQVLVAFPTPEGVLARSCARFIDDEWVVGSHAMSNERVVFRVPPVAWARLPDAPDQYAETPAPDPYAAIVDTSIPGGENT